MDEYMAQLILIIIFVYSAMLLELSFFVTETYVYFGSSNLWNNEMHMILKPLLHKEVKNISYMLNYQVMS
jgi:hypothetical protein